MCAANAGLVYCCMGVNGGEVLSRSPEGVPAVVVAGLELRVDRDFKQTSAGKLHDQATFTMFS